MAATPRQQTPYCAMQHRLIGQSAIIPLETDGKTRDPVRHRGNAPKRKNAILQGDTAMTTTPHDESDADRPQGWGDTPPLPLTPRSDSAPPPADVSTASRAIRRASTDADRASGKELGGPRGPEPTRYNDWEQKGRCSDF